MQQVDILHPVEKIDPLVLLNSFRKKESLKENESPQKISQYTHPNFSNRLIYGDSNKVMQSLLHTENLGNSVRMVYFDPPYGIGYNANFQLRNSVLQEKGILVRKSAIIRAYEDTWKHGIHSYLQYIYDNLFLAKNLLSTDGSIFLQIGDENLANVSKILEEIFGSKNRISLITIKKTSGFGATRINNVCDYILWYAKDKNKFLPKKLFHKKNISLQEILKTYNMVRQKDGSLLKISSKKDFVLSKDQILVRCECIHSEGETSTGSFPVYFQGKSYYPPKGRHWTTHEQGMNRLIQLGRIVKSGNQIAYVRHLQDSPFKALTNLWDDVTAGFGAKEYAVQTSVTCIQRCLLMSTDPGDLVLDITCGSGTTPVVAEQWGRRWIAVDNSSIAIHVTKRRIIYKLHAHYKLHSQDSSVQYRFLYHSFPYVTLKSLANATTTPQETLYGSPLIDKKITRVSSPFKVESFYKIGISYSFSKKDILSCVKDILNKGIASISGEMIQIHQIGKLSEIYKKKVFYVLGRTSLNKTVCLIFNFLSQEHCIQHFFSDIQADLFIFCVVENDFSLLSEVKKYPNLSLMNVNLQLSQQYIFKKKSPTSWLLGDPIISIKKEKNLSSSLPYKIQLDGFVGINASLSTEILGLNRVMMWMVDFNYDGKIFFPSHSYIPMECKESWSKLSIKQDSLMLKELQEGVHRGGKSLPFTTQYENPAKQIAVVVIDDRGRTMFTTIPQNSFSSF